MPTNGDQFRPPVICGLAAPSGVFPDRACLKKLTRLWPLDGGATLHTIMNDVSIALAEAITECIHRRQSHQISAL